MGIQGLIPFLKNASRPVNVRNFSGSTVAVDAYCWLHKGAFSCAERLGKGEKTDGYVHYCMKMVNSLLAAGVQPILVFDGRRLPSKAVTEQKRHENRVKYKKKAKEFLLQGKLKEARECFQRSTEVTSEMALEVIQACRKLGVDYIVAPYEADAQLAYLSKTGIAQVIITEDSDLVLFGCDRIIFKLDMAGNGILVESYKLYLCFGLNAQNFTFEKFRYMCILSGCDYLPSLPGIGLAKACKFFSKVTNPNLTMVLTKIPMYLNMSNITVGKDYIEGFVKANMTFLYQLVFDPLKRRLVPLNDYPPDLNSNELDFAGPIMSNEKAHQIALGNICVETMKKVDNFDPDKDRLNIKSPSWTSKSSLTKSIWDPAFKIELPVIENACNLQSNSSSHSINPTQNLSSTVISTPKNFIVAKCGLKRAFSDSKLDELPTNEELLNMYGEVNHMKKLKIQANKDISLASSEDSNHHSPTIVVHSRFFASVSKIVSPASESKLQSSSSINSCDSFCNESASFSQKPCENKHLDQAQTIEEEHNVLDQSTKNTETVVSTQCRGSLFFDRAISPLTPLKSCDTSSKFRRTCSTSTPLRPAKIFGNWSSLRTYFSYPSIEDVAKFPKSHTEFKPVKASVIAPCSSAGEMKERQQSKTNVEHLLQTSMSDSETSSVNCSETSGSHLDGASNQRSQLKEQTNISPSLRSTEDSDENLFDELNSLRSSSSAQSSKILSPINSNTDKHISKVSRLKALKPSSIAGRCKRLGLPKLKPTSNHSTAGIQPLTIKDTLAKFGFTKTRTQFSMTS